MWYFRSLKKKVQIKSVINQIRVAQLSFFCIRRQQLRSKQGVCGNHNSKIYYRSDAKGRRILLFCIQYHFPITNYSNGTVLHNVRKLRSCEFMPVLFLSGYLVRVLRYIKIDDLAVLRKVTRTCNWAVNIATNSALVHIWYLMKMAFDSVFIN